MKNKNGSQWGPERVWLPTLYKIYSLENHTALEQHEGG